MTLLETLQHPSSYSYPSFFRYSIFTQRRSQESPELWKYINCYSQGRVLFNTHEALFSTKRVGSAQSYVSEILELFNLMSRSAIQVPSDAQLGIEQILDENRTLICLGENLISDLSVSDYSREGELRFIPFDEIRKEYERENRDKNEGDMDGTGGLRRIGLGI